MRIIRITASVHSEPRRTPLRDALQLLDRDGRCTVVVETDEGIEGIGRIDLGRIEHAPALVAAIVDRILAPALLGADPTRIRDLHGRLLQLTDYIGSRGVISLARSAIDQALWDILGKHRGEPVWRMLGGSGEPVPAYATVGWLDLDIEGLQEVSRAAMAQGFRGVKIKVGAHDLDEEVRRIGAVREAIGPDAALMVDANQVFTFAEALRRGRVYEELGCDWFEEPLPASDVEGAARLRERLEIPIAGGESNYGLPEFRALFAAKAVGIVQPDLRRAGGVTECFDIGLAAHAAGIPYASHGGGAHLHVLAALPNTVYVESGLLPDGAAPLVDGRIPLPQEPGLSA